MAKVDSCGLLLPLDRLLIAEATIRNTIDQVTFFEEVSNGNSDSESHFSSTSSSSSLSSLNRKLLLAQELVWREKIVQWFYNVVDCRNESRAVVYVAMNILDRYNAIKRCNYPLLRHDSSSNVNDNGNDNGIVGDDNYHQHHNHRKSYKLASFTALFLAIRTGTATGSSGNCDSNTSSDGGGNKDSSAMPLQLADFVRTSRGSFSVQDVATTGRQMLKDLTWGLQLVTSHDFIHAILQQCFLFTNSKSNDDDNDNNKKNSDHNDNHHHYDNHKDVSSSPPPSKRRRTIAAAATTMPTKEKGTSNIIHQLPEAILNAIRELSFYLVELSVYDPYFAKISASKIAIAAIVVSSNKVITSNANTNTSSRKSTNTVSTTTGHNHNSQQLSFAAQQYFLDRLLCLQQIIFSRQQPKQPTDINSASTTTISSNTNCSNVPSAFSSSSILPTIGDRIEIQCRLSALHSRVVAENVSDRNNQNPNNNDAYSHQNQRHHFDELHYISDCEGE